MATEVYFVISQQCDITKYTSGGSQAIPCRNPFGALDPPVIGRFDNGVGTFYSDGTVDGKPIRTRLIWGQITATSARWEQAYSADAGKTWETNWIMEFRRTS